MFGLYQFLSSRTVPLIRLKFCVSYAICVSNGGGWQPVRRD